MVNHRLAYALPGPSCLGELPIGRMTHWGTRTTEKETTMHAQYFVPPFLLFRSPARKQQEVPPLAVHSLLAVGLFFVAMQNPVFPSPLRFADPTTTHALYYLPRTPPPAFDPEWAPSEEVEAEVHIDFWP